MAAQHTAGLTHAIEQLKFGYHVSGWITGVVAAALMNLETRKGVFPPRAPARAFLTATSNMRQFGAVRTDRAAASFALDRGIQGSNRLRHSMSRIVIAGILAAPSSAS